VHAAPPLLFPSRGSRVRSPKLGSCIFREADADRLAAIEDEKKTLGSADPRLLELSREAELISKRLVPKTVAESALVVENQG
jgi:hypothetical protein